MPGVLDESGALLPQLDAGATETLQARGVIQRGMVPKVRSALAALERGVKGVTIGNLNALRNGSGTTFLARSNQAEITSP